MARVYKNFKKSDKYRHVYSYIYKDKIRWQMALQGVMCKVYDTEIEAAKAADMCLIKQGKDPVNILKKK